MAQSPSPARREPQGPGAAAVPVNYLDVIAADVPLFAAALEAHRQGQLGKARGAYLELMDQPRLTAVCLHQLGVIAGQQGDHRRAAELLERAIRLDPAQPMYYQNLSVSLEKLGNKPAALDALIDLGCALQKVERHDQAIPIYRRIIEIDRCRYAAYVNMGTGLAWSGDPRAAVPELLRGIVLHALVLPELKSFLDGLLPRLIADAVVPHDIVKPPGQPSGRVEMVEHALTSLGKALTEIGYPDEAIRCHRMAIELEPGFALAHWNLSLALLTKSDFAQGWQEYEWRWRWDKFPDPKRRLPVPVWRGQPLAGKTVVVYAEQGYGDVIQFLPLARRLAAMAGEVLLEVTTPQVRLLREGFAGGNLRVIERTREPNRIATERPYDYVVPLLSLPSRLALRLEELPLAREPYITVPPAAAAAWRERLAGAAGLKVGLAWRGRPTPEAKRTIPLERLGPLMACEGVSWHAIQVAGETAEIAASKLPVADWSPQLRDFADTAALVSELDLVISIDTAAAHLAAALGKPVWIMLLAVPDWRWLLARRDSPWYPTARLFRQPAAGDWESVLGELAKALAERQRARAWALRLIDACPAPFFLEG